MTPKEMHLCKNVKNFFYSKYKYNTTEQIIYTTKISFKILPEMWDFLISNSVHAHINKVYKKIKQKWAKIKMTFCAHINKLWTLSYRY